MIAYSVQVDGCDGGGDECVGGIRLVRPSGAQRRTFACPEPESQGCLERTPIFAPRHRLVATSDFTFAGGGRLAVRRPEGSLVRNIDVRGDVTDLAWSGDGRRLVYNDGGALFSIPRTGGTGPKRVLRRRVGRDVAWSRRGRLAWTRNGQLYVTDRNRRNVRKLPALGQWPRWSPDGRRIAFKGSVGDTLRVIRVTNGRSRLITRRCDDIESRLAWSPDGREIACSSAVGHLLAVAVKTRRVRNVAGRVFPVQIDWGRYRP